MASFGVVSLLASTNGIGLDVDVSRSSAKISSETSIKGSICRVLDVNAKTDKKVRKQVRDLKGSSDITRHVSRRIQT